ncbi:MAG TPA: c-type cytochrome, partial [Candidatus Dormibacteraeota bacterium]|nr:c-type cytochrome [Candidatus Dormibacteraeota bacterium]
MRIPRTAVVGSAAIAAVLIGILIGFPISAAKSATPGQGPGQKAAAKGHEAGVIDPRIIERGKQTFGTYCVNCHGTDGKGDGLAGQNLPIKPQNLTEGRIINALPDHFLHSIIAHGGQVVGLSPLMPNFTPFLSDVQIREVIAYVRTLAEPAYDPARVLPVATTRRGPVQPIFFSHVIHAGSYQIACQYCHAGARRSSAAGVPSVERCMGCHKIVAAEG